MRYNKQYISDADRDFKLAQNSLLLNIQRFGKLWGVLNWLKNAILRTSYIPIYCLTRFRFGGAVYNFFNLIFFHFLMVYVSVFLSQEELIEENSEALNALKSLPIAHEINLSPLEFLSLNPVSAIFTWMIILIALLNMLHNQLLPEEKKPNFFSRGISLITLLKPKPKDRPNSKTNVFSMSKVSTEVERAATKYDINGVNQRILEPFLFGSIGALILLGFKYELLGSLVVPIGICLTVGAISLFLAEMRADTHKARKR